MTARVDVKPEMLRWARERARLDVAVLVRRFPRYLEWEQGTARPTLQQLETFARTSRAPVGYLFLSEAPIEKVPIPDFRTVRDFAIGRPSPEMLDTVYLCQQRQGWYREFARVEGIGRCRSSGPPASRATSRRRRRRCAAPWASTSTSDTCCPPGARRCGGSRNRPRRSACS